MAEETASGLVRIALVGNPNVGKTTLFNRLCAQRHKVSNYPGTTQSAHVGRIPKTSIELIDLPGAYSLELEQSESRTCREVLQTEASTKPDGVLVVVSANALANGLTLVFETSASGYRPVVLLTMRREAMRAGHALDLEGLRTQLGCEVIDVDGLGAGSSGLVRAISDAIASEPSPDGSPTPGPTGEAARARAGAIAGAVLKVPPGAVSQKATDRLDNWLMHPVSGLLAFIAIMGAVFYTVFRLAGHPMGWIESLFGWLGGAIGNALPDGLLQALLVDGVIAGVGSTVIFLPQICLLFLLISLLEESGYLARATMMTDRWLRPFGMSGHAFVPLLSAHACALPAIAAARGVPDRRTRLATILAAPFMSCTARIPVYVLLTVLLFPSSPLLQTVAFAACYGVGILAGLITSLLARRTVLRGESRSVTIELPRYRVPSITNAIRLAGERGWNFLKKAGTLILAVSIILWWLSAFPRGGPELSAQETAQQSYLGRIGDAAQPVFDPLGFDRQLTVGVLASFAAREVFVSTMAIQTTGSDETEGGPLLESLRTATRDDGVTPIFTPAVSWALLIYYVLAMQCLPTLVATAREAGGRGGWKWAALQLAWMQVLAWGFGVIVFQALS